MAIHWGVGERNGTSRVGWLDLPAGVTVEAAIAKLEAAAGEKGDWEFEGETGWQWYGLVGTFDDEVFTVYTHKSGTLKIGGHWDGHLDLPALITALLAVVSG